MNSYFSMFPQVLCSVDGKTVQSITDFLRRVSPTDYAQTNAVLYQQYTINDGETAEYLADQCYGDPELEWIFFLVNNIVDPRYDWPMSNADLLAYCNNKYTNVYDTHHDENTNGLICDNGVGTVSISNLDYEISLNESKRNIAILLPELVTKFVDEMKTQVNS